MSRRGALWKVMLGVEAKRRPGEYQALVEKAFDGEPEDAAAHKSGLATGLASDCLQTPVAAGKHGKAGLGMGGVASLCLPVVEISADARTPGGLVPACYRPSAFERVPQCDIFQLVPLQDSPEQHPATAAAAEEEGEGWEGQEQEQQGDAGTPGASEAHCSPQHAATAPPASPPCTTPAGSMLPAGRRGKLAPVVLYRTPSSSLIPPEASFDSAPSAPILREDSSSGSPSGSPGSSWSPAAWRASDYLGQIEKVRGGVLGLPLLISWLLLMCAYFIPLLKTRGKKPMYVWMWTTGIFFFLITFIEQNLWLVPWFRQSYLRELTIQWKANGATVGAWNQMIYGTSLYLMVKISGDGKKAQGKTVFFFYLLGLTNLMFNWGHHIYNAPAASWIRDTSYIISMTEWVFLIRMIQGFRKTLEEGRKLKHLITYRFIIASEFWVFANLLLTLAMSVPAINRYTHGTHITVAHSMGATIGINTMILLASFSYILGIDQKSEQLRKTIRFNFWLCQFSLFVFWIALIAAGVIKGYRSVVLNMTSFQEIMLPVMPALKTFSVAGIGVVISLVIISLVYIIQAIRCKEA